MSKNAIKVPSTSEMRMIVDANKDLTFKPKINLNSKRIDKVNV